MDKIHLYSLRDPVLTKAILQQYPILISRFNDDTLEWAIKTDNLEILKACFEAGIKISESLRHTTYILAISFPEIFEYLVTNHIDINTVWVHNGENLNLLYLSLRQGFLTLFERLLDAGADPDIEIKPHFLKKTTVTKLIKCNYFMFDSAMYGNVVRIMSIYHHRHCTLFKLCATLLS